MKKLLSVVLILSLLMAGCQTSPGENIGETKVDSGEENKGWENVIQITLDGNDVYVEEGVGVYTDHDIVYYEAGHDFTYGEGLSGDAHEPAEAEAHTVIHITRPGTYHISGTMPAGQIAVDLGKDAKEDPDAVVTLILDGVDITCTVAPAIIFYNVYECADDQKGGPDVDTSDAGANVILADGSVNTVNGAYVAKIYKPDSVVLNKAGTEVEEAQKLHKYDGAFYSKMSMNIFGGEIGDGRLTINARNEGLDSEMHLTIHGGNIDICSGNDGINANEDEVSIVTVNGGSLKIHVLGTDGEGDGIDSNGWLVVNGGVVEAYACGFSADSGIDSDMGIYLNGGTVMAGGQMLDHIAGGDSTYAVFRMNGTISGGTTVTLKNQNGETVMECTPANDFSYLILSGDALVPGTYTLWQDQIQLSGTPGEMGGMMGMPGFPGGMPGNMGTPGDVPGQFEGQPPEGDFQIPPQPGGQSAPQGMGPGGPMGPQDMEPGGAPGEASAEFEIVAGENYFSNVGESLLAAMPIQ